MACHREIRRSDLNRRCQKPRVLLRIRPGQVHSGCRRGPEGIHVADQQVRLFVQRAY